MKSAAAIVFDYRPSRWLIAAIILVTVMGMVALACCAMPWWAKLIVAVVACAYSTYGLRRLQNDAIRRAAWHEAGHWRLADGAGGEHVAELQTGIVRGAWIVLRLRRSDGRRVAIVLGPDNSDAELRRRLRVRLARAREDIG
jgi:toxin CptA